MSIRNESKDILVLSGVSLSVTESKVIDVTLINAFNIQAYWEDLGLFTGRIELLASNSGAIFTVIDESISNISGTDSHMYNAPLVGYRFIKLRFSCFSGTVNFACDINTKGW